jgi:hypothetical protein
MQRIAAICALSALVPGIALGDETFRCGSWLVSMPLSVAELVQKCGQPSSKKVATEDVRAKVGGGGTQKIGTATTETWRYDRGSNSFPMIVTIVDGVIQSLERGE